MLSPEDACAIRRVIADLEALSTRLGHIGRRLRDPTREAKLKEVRSRLTICTKLLAEAISRMCGSCQGPTSTPEGEV